MWTIQHLRKVRPHQCLVEALVLSFKSLLLPVSTKLVGRWQFCVLNCVNLTRKSEWFHGRERMNTSTDGQHRELNSLQEAGKKHRVREDFNT